MVKGEGGKGRTYRGIGFAKGLGDLGAVDWIDA